MLDPNNNVRLQVDIVDYYRGFMLREGIVAEYSHPESLAALMEILNDTLPIIKTSVS